MTPWLPILAIVGGLLVAFYGLRWLVELTWSPQPELQPKRRPRARVVDTRHVRVVERKDR